MDPPAEKEDLETRSRGIVVRTLGTLSWLYAAFAALVGLMIVGQRGPAPAEGLYSPRAFGALLLAHAALLGAAGAGLRGGRRWGWPAAFAAAAGALALLVPEVRKANYVSAFLDGLYALLVAAAWLLARRAP